MVFIAKVARVARSQYIVNAIKHFNELYNQPTFLIRSVKKIGSTPFHNFWGYQSKKCCGIGEGLTFDLLHFLNNN